MENRGKFKKISFICFLIAMLLLSLVCIPLVRGYNNLSAIEGFIEDFGVLSVFALLFIQILQIIVALIPGEVVEFAAGALFGPVWGTLIGMLGILLGQWLIFTIVIRWGNSVLSAVLDKKFMKKFKFLHDEKKIKLITFILYFLPGTPKDLLTYFMPVTGINIKAFLSITIFARIPSVVSSTIAGSLYAEGDIKLTLIVYAVVTVLSGLGYLIYRLIFDRRGKNGTDR
ncbi:MAG: TVP38/TMEM64 family protein [Clostridia bacterium]|nr:TVP38/TMEM64 family protein [Clostridia bacterium]